MSFVPAGISFPDMFPLMLTMSPFVLYPFNLPHTSSSSSLSSELFSFIYIPLPSPLHLRTNKNLRNKWKKVPFLSSTSLNVFFFYTLAQCSFTEIAGWESPSRSKTNVCLSSQLLVVRLGYSIELACIWPRCLSKAGISLLTPGQWSCFQ